MFWLAFSLLSDTFIPVPSRPSDSRHSSASSCAAALSSLPKLLSAKSRALQQTDRRARSDRASSARRVHANETSGLTAFPEQYAVALFRLQLALRSSRPAPL